MNSLFNQLTHKQERKTIDIDQQQLFLDREVLKIKTQRQVKNKKPYILSSFNESFDNSLKQLVVDYRFDFDKIALHLYYLFPVYEQKITSRTVAVRWWQLKIQDEINQNKQQHNVLNSIKQQKANISQNKLSNIFDQRQQDDKDNISYFMQRQQQNNKILNNINKKNNILSLRQYKNALEQSLILQQQQSQRPIMYKPKFIIDSQYKLQRYEIFDDLNHCIYHKHNNQEQNNNNQIGDSNQQENLQKNIVQDQQNKDQNKHYNSNNSNMKNIRSNNQIVGIQQMLSKVVNNQFVYDQFGGFNAKQIKNQQLSQQTKLLWWQKQLSISSESQQSSSQQQQQYQQQQNVEKYKIKKHKHQLQNYPLFNNYQQYQQDKICYDNQPLPYKENNFFQQKREQNQQKQLSQFTSLSIIPNNSLNQPLIINQKNKQTKKQIQIYQLDDNWDQYQSD